MTPFTSLAGFTQGAIHTLPSDDGERATEILLKCLQLGKDTAPELYESLKRDVEALTIAIGIVDGVFDSTTPVTLH